MTRNEDMVRDALKAQAATIKNLREALEAHQAHILKGQELVVRFLIPSVDPISIEKEEFISCIIGHFDGPEQRDVKAKATQALKETSEGCDSCGGLNTSCPDGCERGEHRSKDDE